MIEQQQQKFIVKRRQNTFFKSLLTLGNPGTGERGGAPAALMCELAPWDRCCFPWAR